jgi:cation diffusion facilitator family transporter
LKTAAHDTAVDSKPRRRVLTPMGITLVGLVVNVLLSAVKLVGGVLFGSSALAADGIHSASDLISDIAVVAGLRLSSRDADDTHPYGHHRIQTLTAMFVGLLVVAAAGWVGVSAAVKWRGQTEVEYGWVPFSLAMLSVVVKETLYRLTRRVARRSGDPALRANAWHHRSDAFSSIAAAAGMFGVAAGGAKWGFLDHFTAIALAGVLVTIGLRLAAQAAAELVDTAPTRAVMNKISAIVAETAGVRTYHAFRMRQLGGKLEMDVHVMVDPELTVAEGHDVATEVRRRIFEADPNITTAIVHVEPAED